MPEHNEVACLACRDLLDKSDFESIQDAWITCCGCGHLMVWEGGILRDLNKQDRIDLKEDDELRNDLRSGQEQIVKHMIG